MASATSGSNWGGLDLYHHQFICGEKTQINDNANKKGAIQTAIPSVPFQAQ